MSEQYFNNRNKGFLISAILALPIGFAYCQYTDAPFFSCVLGCLLALAAFFTVFSDCDKKYAVFILGIFAIKFALTAYQALYKDLPLGGEDWGNYHAGAQRVLERTDGLFGILGDSADMFTRLVAVIYSIFGVHTRQINLYILASAFVAARYVFKTAMELTEGDSEASQKALLLFLIWPINIVYSVTYLREMPVQMFTIISFCCFVQYTKTGQISKFIKAVAAILIANMMHSGVIALLLIYIIFIGYREGERIRSVFSPANLAVALLVIAVLMASPLWGSVVAKLGIGGDVDLVERTSQFLEGDANTKYIHETPTSVAGIIMEIPYRTLLFAFVPLPWMIISFDTAISWVIDALPQFWLWYRLIDVLRLSRKSENKKYKGYVIIALVCIVATYIVCGLGTTAYGNAIRHRAKIVPLVLVFAEAVHFHLKYPLPKEEKETK